MRTFEITIRSRADNVWPVEVQPSSYLRSRREGELELSPGTLEALQVAEPLEHGQTLGKALFQGDIDRAFQQALSAARQDAKEDPERGILRVLLFPEADDLPSEVRWEHLCAPVDGLWPMLALSEHILYSFSVPSAVYGLFQPIGPAELKALVVVASPKDSEKHGLPSFDAGSALSSVCAALGDVHYDILANTEGALGPPSSAAIKRQLGQESYTILHLVCHGRHDPQGKDAILYLADENAETEQILGRNFEELLSGVKRRPYLAFVAACESAVAEADQSFRSLAWRLVEGLGLPAVVAMTRTINPDTASQIASAFYEKLRLHGEVDRALAEARAGLDLRSDLTVPMVYSRLGAHPLFSSDPGRPLSPAEKAAGLERLGELLNSYAPVLRPEFDRQATTLRQFQWVPDAAALPEEERLRHASALSGIRLICSDALSLSFEELARGQDPARSQEQASSPPFLGLYPFRWADRDLFFGRGSLVEALEARLHARSFLAVLGPSGSGKSSVVLAGLVPRLLGRNHEELPCSYLHPGNEPLAALETTLAREPQPRLLVVDQFEETFSLCDDRSQRQAFIDRLLELAETRQVVVTMRIDFLGDCMQHPRLVEAIKGNQEWVAPMNTTELNSAMQRQAAAAGLRFEADLKHTILEALQEEPGAMPLLQHVLRELWNRRHGQWLRAAEYRAMGGLRAAIGRTADRLYDTELNDRERRLVRQIFVRLTRLGEETSADNIYLDTRRRVTLDELTPAGQDQDTIHKLVRSLAGARLVVTRRDLDSGAVEVDVAHEALIRHWGRLRGWLDEDRRLLRLREGVRRAAQEWQEQKNDSYLTHHGERLKEVQVLLDHPRVELTDGEKSYLEACQEQSRQAKKSVADAGWGVIFAHDADPAIRYALRELLDHRRRAIEKTNPDFYHEFSGADGYRPGDTLRRFLARHDVGSTLPTPDRMPYYLMIVGDPETIPFSFQYQLDIQYAVGRIHFETLDQYAQYARSVVMTETGQAPLPRRMVIFAPDNTDDQATTMSHDHLATPIASNLEVSMPRWRIERVFKEQATKANLRELVGGRDTPPLLFSCGHGMDFVMGSADQVNNQGAVLCQDWPGPLAHRDGIPRTFYFSADDVAPDAGLMGTIFYFWNCYGAGTPKWDNYALMRTGQDRRQIAKRAFLARLPLRLLSHPRGGALAIIGSVERKWGYAFAGELGEKDVDVFMTTLLQLMESYPVGAAMEYFNQRYTALMSELVAMLEASQVGQVDQRQLASQWTAVNDARNYIILGDPAVRIHTGDTEQAERRTIEPGLQLDEIEQYLYNALEAAAMRWHREGRCGEDLVHRDVALDYIDSYGTLMLQNPLHRVYVRACRLANGIEEAAVAWDTSDRPESSLIHSGQQFTEIETTGLRWRDPTTQAYLDACRDAVLRDHQKMAERGRVAAYLQTAAARAGAPAEPRSRTVSKAGWGVIWAGPPHPEVREALLPLLDLRRSQATVENKEGYAEYSAESGYRPGESAVEFLHRLGADVRNPLPVGKVPRHLLLVGGPEAIPFEFQYDLALQYAVGRLAFDTAEDYAHYARNVVALETAAGRHQAQTATFFSPRHPDDQASALMADRLTAPLMDYFEQALPEWTAHGLLRDRATKARLLQLLSGQETPALLFCAAHGVRFPLGDENQRCMQGALLCQDWPGPNASGYQVLTPALFLHREDISPAANLGGLIAIFAGGFTAGTPHRQDFAWVREEPPEVLAETPFVAPLPQRLLSLPQGGAQAVIGHVDEPWATNISGRHGESGLQAIRTLLTGLAHGWSVGLALDALRLHQAALAAELVTNQQEDDAETRETRLAILDARNYIILGDPAVRLRVDQRL